jgi:hypothetical protein
MVWVCWQHVFNTFLASLEDSNHDGRTCADEIIFLEKKAGPILGGPENTSVQEPSLPWPCASLFGLLTCSTDSEEFINEIAWLI